MTKVHSNSALSQFSSGETSFGLLSSRLNTNKINGTIENSVLTKLNDSNNALNYTSLPVISSYGNMYNPNAILSNNYNSSALSAKSNLSSSKVTYIQTVLFYFN